MDNVKHIIIILSGKGGVGKSTVATQLAIALHNRGNKVGILDVDLCGPSIPKMLNLDKKTVYQCSQGWVPVYLNEEKTFSIMSIAFLLSSPNEPIIWRGPKKNAMIKQFISDVFWEDLDFLIVDTPPGTSDEHMSVVEFLTPYKLSGAILVTTPQLISINDVRREITFCNKRNISILGVIENMSGYVCPHCEECTNIFSKGGGSKLAEYAHIPYLGALPLDSKLAMTGDKGTSLLDSFEHSPLSTAFNEIINNLIENNFVKQKI